MLHIHILHTPAQEIIHCGDIGDIVFTTLHYIICNVCEMDLYWYTQIYIIEYRVHTMYIKYKFKKKNMGTYTKGIYQLLILIKTPNRYIVVFKTNIKYFSWDTNIYIVLYTTIKYYIHFLENKTKNTKEENIFSHINQWHYPYLSINKLPCHYTYKKIYDLLCSINKIKLISFQLIFDISNAIKNKLLFSNDSLLWMVSVYILYICI